MNETPDVMTVKELCDYLRTSRPVVMNMIKEGLPYFTLSGSEDSHKRFNKTEIDQWLLTNRAKKEKTTATRPTS